MEKEIVNGVLKFVFEKVGDGEVVSASGLNVIDLVRVANELGLNGKELKGITTSGLGNIRLTDCHVRVFLDEFVVIF